MIPDTEFKVQYPIYLIDNSEVDVIRSAREGNNGLESWMMARGDTTDKPWQTRAFDNNCTFLSIHELPWCGGAFEFFIDSAIDHRSDKETMRALLICLLLDQEIIPDVGTVEGWSMDRLLATALHRHMS